LKFHPTFMPGTVTGLSVRWGRVADGRMMLRYRLDGCGDVVLPKKPATGRGDKLWRTTCFELFIADPGGRYREFNFAPSGQWAAYQFEGYRNSVGDYEPLVAPEILTDSGASVLTVTAFLSAEEFAGSRHVGLTAVIEEKRRRMSYWADRHPGLKPDFHNPACFVLPVP
jgi:hypothetical protein